MTCPRILLNSCVQGAPSDNNIMVWDAVIYGPADTPFEDGTFKLQIEFSEEYPNKPPKVKFMSKMFHPNVYNDGSMQCFFKRIRMSWFQNEHKMQTPLLQMLRYFAKSMVAHLQSVRKYLFPLRKIGVKKFKVEI